MSTIERPEYRRVIGDRHEHTYDGQHLRHSHTDGGKPHGYFGHPEDAGLPHYHSAAGPLGCSRCDLAREAEAGTVYTALHDYRRPPYASGLAGVYGVSTLVGVFSTEERAQFASDQDWLEECGVLGRAYVPLQFKDAEADDGALGKYVIVMTTLDVPTGQG